LGELQIRVVGRDGLNALFDGLLPIRQYKEAQRAEIVADIKWWTFDNPSGEGVQAGLYDGDRLAGVANITPKPFLHQGKPILLAEIGGTETSPDFRGRGVFSQLVEFLVGMARERGYGGLYGTPNEASGHIYMGKKLAWTGVFHWQRQLRLVNWSGARELLAPRLPVPARFKGAAGAVAGIAGRLAGPVWDAALGARVSRGGVSVSGDVAPELGAFLAEAMRGAELVLDRSDAYLRWRYGRPGRVYRHVYLRGADGALRGWAVYMQTVSPEGRPRALVSDYWVLPGSAQTLRALMTAVFREAKARRLEQVYVMSRPVRGPQLGWRDGFISTPSQMPVIAKPLTLDLETFAQWDYRDGDADMA
jgi:GNAT superfamily N-acetyltransferase